jgi:hypothetical protein
LAAFITAGASIGRQHEAIAGLGPVAVRRRRHLEQTVLDLDE